MEVLDKKIEYWEHQLLDLGNTEFGLWPNSFEIQD